MLQRHVRQDHAELVATVAARQVIFPHIALQFLTQLPQDPVADDMAIGIVDLLEVVDINQCDGGLGLSLLALVKLQLQQVLPRPVIEQAGQAVGTAQGTQGALVFRELDGQAIAGHADGDGVENQHRQAGIHLDQADIGVERRTEHQPGHCHAHQLREHALDHQLFAARRDVMHGHHREDGHCSQGRELCGCGPEPAGH